MGNFFEEAGEFLGLSTPDGPPQTGRDGHQGSPWGSEVSWNQGLPDRAPSRNNPYRYAWQYEADRQTELYRRSLFRDARGSMRQGIGVMESYRPGGSAALAGGMYHGMANLYAGQASQLQSPDVMMNIRDKAQVEANRESQRAAGMGRLIGLAGTIAGFAVGGPAGAAVGSQLGQAVGGSQAPSNAGIDPGLYRGQSGTGSVASTGGAMPQPPSAGASGGGLSGPAVPTAGAAGGVAGGAAGGGAAGMAGGGGARIGGPQPGPPGGGGFGGAPAPGGVAGAPPGAPVGGNLFPQGGVGVDGNFSPTSSAASAARSANPVVETAVQQKWAQSAIRKTSAALMVTSARQRLEDAQRAFANGPLSPLNYIGPDY